MTDEVFVQGDKPEEVVFVEVVNEFGTTAKIPERDVEAWEAQGFKRS